MHCLGGLIQYRGVTYVEKEGSYYRCLLCGTGSMHKRTAGVRGHFTGSLHAANYQAVKRLEEQEETDRQDLLRLNNAKRIKLDVVGGLCHEPWRVEMKSLLLDHLTAPAPIAAIVVDTALKRYQKMEQLSLLELALWKAKICDGLTFSTMQEMREYQVLDEDFDPKTFAQEMRHTSGCQVVVPLVSAFLG